MCHLVILFPGETLGYIQFPHRKGSVNMEN